MVRRGFTLIELLVVVAVIALLIGILLPSLVAATRVSKGAACASQMRQIGIATLMYTDDYRGLLPRSSHSAFAFRQLPWGYALCPYLSYGRYKGSETGWKQVFNSLYRCPQDRRRDTNRYSYGKNVWFELQSAETAEVLEITDGPTFWRISQIKFPARTIGYGELAGGNTMVDHIMAHFWYFGGEPEVDRKRHGRTANYTYLDGHVDKAVFENTFDLTRKVDCWKPLRPGDNGPRLSSQ